MGDVLILSAGHARAQVDPSDGGRLTSLQVEGAELLGGDQAPAGAPAGWFSGCFPMAPFAGKLNRGQFTFDGRTYKLPTNSGLHAQHGTVFDRRWNVDVAETTRLSMSVALDEPWPFSGVVEQSIVLESHALSLSLTVRSHETPMPAALGFHPWFRRDLGAGPAVIDVAPRLRYQPDKTGIVGKTDTDLGQRPWDDTFTGLASPPRIQWPGGPVLTLESDAPVWIVYERPQSALCIEPLTDPPNSLGTDRGTVICPGAPLHLALTIRWGPP